MDIFDIRRDSRGDFDLMNFGFLENCSSDETTIRVVHVHSKKTGRPLILRYPVTKPGYIMAGFDEPTIRAWISKNYDI